jgi:hypothetical protein
MVTRTYKSTDVGAPALTGQIDSLNNLLKALLVTGIGAAIASPWAVAFEDAASHTVVFRPPQGPRHYLQVNDSGNTPAGAAEATMRGFGAMTGFNTGTDPFPTVAQQASGLYVRKSNTLNNVSRAWRAYVDEKTLYLFIDCGDVAGTWDFYAFGAFLDWVPTGAWGSMILGRYAGFSQNHSNAVQSYANIVSSGASPGRVYGPRDYSQNGTATEYTGIYDAAAVNNTAAGVPGAFGQPYPYPVDNGIIIMPSRLALGGLPVGRLRGLWLPGHAKPLVQDDTFNATEGTLTRGFVAQNFLATGQLFIETSNTWDTE